MNINAQTAHNVWDYWHRMGQSVLAGQMLDTTSATRKSFAHEQILQTIELKTAAYSIISPMKIGGTLANAPDDFLMLAKTYGKAFGIAYQLQDDLLDILHTEETTDKTVGRDIGQHTYITDYIATHATPDQQKQLSHLQRSASPSCELLRELVLESKTDIAIHHQINVYFNEAKAALVKSNLTPAQQLPWHALIELLEKRDR
jgi:geranylgeranyl pyrophosphate synthase